MKKTITAIIFLWLFFYFLVYAGFFRQNSNPIKVTQFYFECMRDYEWMLTYPVTKPDFFIPSKLVSAMEEIFQKTKIKKMQFEPSEIENDTAFIKVELTCEDQRIIKAISKLRKNQNNYWLIEDVTYE